jgi:drug/metabolite transporter (DMT)-like permease
MPVADPGWLWLPITVFASAAQTMRNAAQRHLTGELGTLGATLVRFLYGLPFAVFWLLLVLGAARAGTPTPDWAFVGWVAGGAVLQLAATAFLLRAMAERNFALGVAYSKTEIVQVAVFGTLFLGDPLTPATAVSVAFATVGVLLLSPGGGERPLVAFARGWTSRAALLGLGSGAGFALSAVGFRGAALELAPAAPPLAAAYTLVWAQAIQVLLLGGWLLVREPEIVRRTLAAWRVSLLAGLMGALASIGWFTAMAMAPVANVRTLGVLELIFSFIVSRRIFRETLGRRELVGIALLALGIVGVAQLR